MRTSRALPPPGRGWFVPIVGGQMSAVPPGAGPGVAASPPAAPPGSGPDRHWQSTGAAPDRDGRRPLRI